MAEIAIDIVGVTKRFAEHTAVRDLTLRVPTGSVYGLLGPNGAGKTTTIRMILNIIAPDSGKIHIFGRSSNDPHITQRLGYLPEERGLYRKMQVKRVLKFLAELKGVRAKEAERRIDEWLERLSLKTAEKIGGSPRSTSCRGMQQRCSSSARCRMIPTW
jgi:ABC-2 type transport system ATP-binding protein